MDATQEAELLTTVGDDYVATLQINRPPNNFFDVTLIGLISDALDELGAGDDCRAVVLTSNGRHFCAGANFAGDDPLARQGRHLYEEAIRMFEQPLPIVAAVNGAAIGGGLGLALAADFRVAAPESRFASNFALLGFHHGFGLTVTLPAAVGMQKALDLLYTGRRVGGEEAFEIGLCDRLVPAERVVHDAHAFAAEIAASAPLAVRSIRETMRGEGLAEKIRAATARERAEQERLQKTEDWQEGLRAVAERRTANFQGR